MKQLFFALLLSITSSSICCIHASPLTQTIGNPVGTNFPTDSEGRVYHLGLKKGEIANRILLVGDPDRAQRIVECLDNPDNVFTYASNRGFTTYTGLKEGKPVTIMAIGMGLPMMDFAVREIRAITEGPLSIIRLGSCGTPHDTVSIGTVVVAEESYGVLTEYDAYHSTANNPSVSEESYFRLTKTLKPNKHLHNTLISCLEKASQGTFPVVAALDATADSFYSTQGRLDDNFDDRNHQLIDSIMRIHPETASLQMETYHLFHLAHLNGYTKKPNNSIRAAACAIVLAQRKSDAFLSNDLKYLLEVQAGNACLEALVHE